MEWVENNTDILCPLYKKMAYLIKNASDGLKDNVSKDEREINEEE